MEVVDSGGEGKWREWGRVEARDSKSFAEGTRAGIVLGRVMDEAVICVLGFFGERVGGCVRWRASQGSPVVVGVALQGYHPSRWRRRNPKIKNLALEAKSPCKVCKL